MKYFTDDDISDVAIRITNKLVEMGYVLVCTTPTIILNLMFKTVSLKF